MMTFDTAFIRDHPYLTLALLFLACSLLLTFYRLYLHPLAHIPGPKLAAATHWYECYYDVVRRGQYLAKIAQFHEQYGPIIRITPSELHCLDPAFIDIIYASGGSGRKRDKSIFNLNAFQFWHSCFAAVDHDLHRLRRSSMNPFFSKASVTRLEPTIKSYINTMCNHIATYASTKEPCNLSYAFSCVSTDIITDFSFGWSGGYTKNRTFEPNLFHAMLGGQQPVHVFRHFPFLLPIMDNWIPESIAAKLIPNGGEYFSFQHGVFDTVDRALRGDLQFEGQKGKPTIFKEILEGDLPESEKTRSRLREGAREIIGAGTFTTSGALSVACYYLLAYPETMAKLQAELKHTLPNEHEVPSSLSVERLPYLISHPISSFFSAAIFTFLYSAVLHEALRFSCGVSGRLPRVPHETLYYRGTHKGKDIALTIPARTSIGTSTYLVHQNPDVFPEPHLWKPERWLREDGTRNRELEKHLMSFSKGTRQCLGINLAWAELHIALATLVRRFGDRMELYETGLDEIEYKFDLFEPGRTSNKGIRVLVH